jgi:hypothetical protein
VRQHVYYEKSDSSFVLPKKAELGFYMIIRENTSPMGILKITNSFMWKTFSKIYRIRFRRKMGSRELQ